MAEAPKKDHKLAAASADTAEGTGARQRMGVRLAPVNNPNLPAANYFATPNTTCRSLAYALAAVIALAVPQTSAAQSVVVREASLKRNCLDRGTNT